MKTRKRLQASAVSFGVRKIAPEENCPPVRVSVWFRVSVRIRVGGRAIFLGGNFPRTFSFVGLNLVKKAVLHIFLIMVDYVKNALRNRQQIPSNAEHFQGKS